MYISSYGWLFPHNTYFCLISIAIKLLSNEQDVSNKGETALFNILHYRYRCNRITTRCFRESVRWWEFYESFHLTLLANGRYCRNVELSAAGNISDLSRRNDVLNKTNKSRSQWSESSDQSNSQKTFRAGNTATKWPIVQIERNIKLEVPELSLCAICLSKYFCSLEALSAQRSASATVWGSWMSEEYVEVLSVDFYTVI
jgi:hypothetical protein